MAPGDEGWEARMAARHRKAAALNLDDGRKVYLGEVFMRYWPQECLRPDFGIEINPEIIAANCLGITYGDPGPRLPPDVCRECWGERHIWLGNAWGMRHAGGTMDGCEHPCHAGEVWMASA